MTYVERRDGKIVGVYAIPQPGYAEEEIADDHPDLVAFRNPAVDLSAIDLATLNATLAQDGSVVRALALVFLDEINRLRSKAGLATYSAGDLKSALKAKMRS